MKLGALAKLGKFGSRVDEYENRQAAPAEETITVAPKRVWLNAANFNTADVNVTTRVDWNVN